MTSLFYKIIGHSLHEFPQPFYVRINILPLRPAFYSCPDILRQTRVKWRGIFAGFGKK
jgi:hypothetical protein